MQNQNTLTVAARFKRLIGVFLILTVVTSVFSLHTLMRLRVNGPVSQMRKQQMDLLADIAPPPLYLVEAYADALRVVGESDPEKLKEEFQELQSRKEDFLKRREFWIKELNGSSEARLLAEDCTKPGMVFFETLEKELLPAVQNRDQATAASLAHGKLKAAFMEHRKGIDQLVAVAQESSDQIEKSANQEAAVRISLLIVVLLGGLAAVWLYSQRVMRTLVGTLKSAADQLAQGCHQVSVAAAQISASSQNLSSASSEQASSVEETSASLEEMTSMIRATSENAQKAKTFASETRAVTDAGSVTMQEMDRTMAEMNQAMAAIEMSSGEVAKIVKNIDEIAFQTNILALNAAVEAARAGEAGAGFAVVADEVRSLAQRSAAAAKETAAKIEAAIASSRNGAASCRNGSTSSAKVGESLKHISDKISATDALVGDIATAAREQAQGIEQINTAIAQMEQVSQSNASSAEESAAAAEELSAQSKTLNDLVEKLRDLVGRNGSTGSVTSDPQPPLPRQWTTIAVDSGNRTQHNAARIKGAPARVSIPMPKETPALGSGGDDDFRNF